MIDHTLLKPEATKEEIALFIQEAIDLGVGAICISPSHLPLSAQQTELLKQANIRLATVVGFPSGAHLPAIKAAEARAASLAGAEEIDMVINLALRHDKEALESEIRAVREATPGTLKVIIESALLSREEIISIAQIVEESGADFIKTSTGFHPAGGASVEAVAVMKEVLGDRLGIKASGGIRDAATAEAMIAAGATRLGLSSSAQILAAGED